MTILWPSHLKLPGGPKMARGALSRRAMYYICSGQAGRRLFAICRLGGALMARTYPHYTGRLNEPTIVRLK